MEKAALDGSRGTGHFVRFYHDDSRLLQEVADFLDEALRTGGAGIVIATGDHIAALRRHLAGLGSVEGQPGWFSGELITLDAAEALAQFMIDDWPDERRFDDTIGKIIRQTCTPGRTVNAFGEMVALLCEQGLYDAAIRVEQLWNRLLDNCFFSLFCAYPWHLFPTEELTAAFGQVCAEHDHVCSQTHLPSYPAPKDAHFRLAHLEQQTLALTTEIERLKESEQTLRHREREFADFVENAAEGLHRVGPDGTILWANKAELALLGYRWNEYVGHHIAEFYADQPVIEAILARLQAGETLRDQPVRLRCKDGSIKHVLIHSNAHFEDGRLRYTRCFTRDATDRHQLEQAHIEREALLDELTRANRAKDEFLAMLAHELRNPLAPISTAAQLLERAAFDPARVKQATGIIARQVGHLTGLIDDLLDVARVTRGLIVLTEEALDFRHVLSDAVEQATPQIRAKQHRLELHLPPDPVNVTGDRKRLVQVVTNMLTNAAKYTSPGGNITVRLQLLPDEVVLGISDNGIGMTPELVAQVFNLFTQAERTSDRSQGGLGLGLALVKALTEAHGGSAHAESEGLGKGSTFTVRLPRLVSNEPVAVPDSSTVDVHIPASEPKLRIMVVDDNADAAVTLEMLLRAAGHEVLTESTASGAIERARVTTPQVFLLDIGLPDMDGKTLARQLRTIPELAHAVLIAVSGYGQEQDQQNSFAAGFDHHLVKPVDSAKLLALLAQFRASPGGEKHVR